MVVYLPSRRRRPREVPPEETETGEAEGVRDAVHALHLRDGKPREAEALRTSIAGGEHHPERE